MKIELASAQESALNLLFKARIDSVFFTDSFVRISFGNGNLSAGRIVFINIECGDSVLIDIVRIAALLPPDKISASRHNLLGPASMLIGSDVELVQLDETGKLRIELGKFSLIIYDANEYESDLPLWSIELSAADKSRIHGLKTAALHCSRETGTVEFFD
jgi:hypothetical protein